MMVLKFYFIPNMEKFTALVAACRGRVPVRREEAFQNLKGDDDALAFVKEKTDRGRGVEIHLNDTRDYASLVHFMVGACLYD